MKINKKIKRIFYIYIIGIALTVSYIVNDSKEKSVIVLCIGGTIILSVFFGMFLEIYKKIVDDSE